MECRKRTMSMDFRQSCSHILTFSALLIDLLLASLAFRQAGHDNWVSSVTFHPTGLHLISAADDHSFKIWDLKTGRCARTVVAHDAFISSIVWGPQPPSVGEGTTVNTINVIASASSDKVLDILNDIFLHEADNFPGLYLKTVKIWLP